MDKNTFDQALQSIREAERSTLAIINELRQNADKDLLPALDTIRRSSLSSIEAASEIIEKRAKKPGTSRG